MEVLRADLAGLAASGDAPHVQVIDYENLLSGQVQEIINLFRLEGAEVQLSAVRVRERRASKNFCEKCQLTCQYLLLMLMGSTVEPRNVDGRSAAVVCQVLARRPGGDAGNRVGRAHRWLARELCGGGARRLCSAHAKLPREHEARRAFAPSGHVNWNARFD